MLLILVPPKLTKTPDRSYTFHERESVKLTCQAFGFPPPVIQWSRPLFTLPKGRSSVSNGTLSIQDYKPEDTGTYMCTATNKLLSTRVLTALGVPTLESGNNLKKLYASFNLAVCYCLLFFGERVEWEGEQRLCKCNKLSQRIT